MAQLIISIDGTSLKEIELPTDPIKFGRRPSNDIVLDHLLVSGEHALLMFINNQYVIEDLNSTNGTFVNGQKIKKTILSPDDVIELGKYQMKFKDIHDQQNQDLANSITSLSSLSQTSSSQISFEYSASFRFLNGKTQGKTIPMKKKQVSIGKAGLQVVSVFNVRQGFAIKAVEGNPPPTLNNKPIVKPSLLHSGDVIEVLSIKLEFILQNDK